LFIINASDNINNSGKLEDGWLGNGEESAAEKAIEKSRTKCQLPFSICPAMNPMFNLLFISRNCAQLSQLLIGNYSKNIVTNL